VKKLGIGLLVLVLLVGGGLYFLYENLGIVVKMAVEKYGSAATQASVRLDGVKIDIPGGAGSIAGFKVGNPPGFSTPAALLLSEISLKFDKASLTSDGPIIIDQIIIDKPAVTYERTTTSGNLETIQKNAAAYADKMGAKTSSAPSDKKAGRKLIIKDLVIRDGQIAISQTALQGRMLSAELPTIHLRNIGEKSGGATPAEVIEEVLGAITSSASRIGTKELMSAVGSVGGLVGDQIDTSGTGKKLKGLFGQ